MLTHGCMGSVTFVLSLGAGVQKDFLHDPLSSSEQLRKYLVATDELRGVGTSLAQRHTERKAYEEYMSSLDRQLAEVAKTRAVLAQACQVRPARTRDASLEDARSDGRSSVSTLEDAARCQAASLPSESRPKAKAKPKDPKPSVVELRPLQCFPRCVGEECPCCLGRLEATDLIMCFPCPAEHVFHSQCLIQWLRSAKSRSTCPVCRAWPRAKQISPSHP